MENFLRKLPGIADVIDILIVAALFYWLMILFKRTRAERMLLGLALVIVVYFISEKLELMTLNWILANFLGSIVILVIVVFQKDIRRALIQMGKPFAGREGTDKPEFVEHIAGAVAAMSKDNVGGLIAIERGEDLLNYVAESGVAVDADISRDLLLAIFNTGSAMHDGAVIVKNGRIAKAGCILPLSKAAVDPTFGTRHRAAIGLSEETDAVLVVVSENTGNISIISEDMRELGVDPVDVAPILRELVTSGAGYRKKIISNIRG
ncbi:MAG: diadenylate cyclase CdaA [Deltaproteobacteria bacterium]|nr:diadenylate cyclase CdaA [Deltaproteobacteria bacterium]